MPFVDADRDRLEQALATSSTTRSRTARARSASSRRRRTASSSCTWPTGPGFPPEFLDARVRPLQPRRRGAQPRRGGLGLSIVELIAAAHGGTRRSRRTATGAAPTCGWSCPATNLGPPSDRSSPSHLGLRPWRRWKPRTSTERRGDPRRDAAHARLRRFTGGAVAVAVGLARCSRRSQRAPRTRRSDRAQPGEAQRTSGAPVDRCPGRAARPVQARRSAGRPGAAGDRSDTVVRTAGRRLRRLVDRARRPSRRSARRRSSRSPMTPHSAGARVLVIALSRLDPRAAASAPTPSSHGSTRAGRDGRGLRTLLRRAVAVGLRAATRARDSSIRQSGSELRAAGYDRRSRSSASRDTGRSRPAFVRDSPRHDVELDTSGAPCGCRPASSSTSARRPRRWRADRCAARRAPRRAPACSSPSAATSPLPARRRPRLAGAHRRRPRIAARRARPDRRNRRRAASRRRARPCAAGAPTAAKRTTSSTRRPARPRRRRGEPSAWRDRACVDANIAATAAIVLGEAAPAWLEERALPARLVRVDGATVRPAGWPEDGGRPHDRRRRRPEGALVPDARHRRRRAAAAHRGGRPRRSERRRAGAAPRWPRFVVGGLHRNLTLLAIAFVAVHVVTTVADGYAPIGLRDAFIPFVSPYRPVWLGLGAVAFDLLLALVVTSLLRARIGYRALAARALARVRLVAGRARARARHGQRRRPGLDAGRRSRRGRGRRRLRARARLVRPAARRRCAPRARQRRWSSRSRSASGTRRGRRGTAGRGAPARRRRCCPTRNVLAAVRTAPAASLPTTPSRHRPGTDLGVERRERPRARRDRRHAHRRPRRVCADRSARRAARRRRDDDGERRVLRAARHAHRYSGSVTTLAGRRSSALVAAGADTGCDSTSASRSTRRRGSSPARSTRRRRSRNELDGDPHSPAQAPAGRGGFCPDCAPTGARPACRSTARYGPLPGSVDLIELADASGLRGRGGGGFPTAAKLRAVAQQRAAAGRRRQRRRR